MKRIRKQIKQTFDHVPHKSKAETLASLGITNAHTPKPYVRRRVAWIACCTALLCALGTSLVLALDDPSIIGKLLEIVDRTESSETSVEETVPTVSEPSFESVMLTSTSWIDDLPKPVLGTFDTLSQAMQAVETEHTFYYPTWDGGHLQEYGKNSTLLISINPYGVLDPSTYQTTYYVSMQFHFQTKNVNFFKIVLGRNNNAPTHYDETYEFEGNTFYLYRSPYGEQLGGVFANGNIGTCGYSMCADSFDDIKALIDSLVICE